jgi:hypothetical protein
VIADLSRRYIDDAAHEAAIYQLLHRASADDEDAPHRKISKCAAALIVQISKISEACGTGSFSALPGKHHVHRPHHSPHLLAFLMREL